MNLTATETSTAGKRELLAFYGTLKDAALNDKVLGHKVELGKDKIRGMKKVDEGDNYTTIEPESGGSVPCDTYLASPADVDKLNEWETGKWDYTLEPVTLESGRKAQAFMITGGGARPKDHATMVMIHLQGKK